MECNRGYCGCFTACDVKRSCSISVNCLQYPTRWWHNCLYLEIKPNDITCSGSTMFLPPSLSCYPSGVLSAWTSTQGCMCACVFTIICTERATFTILERLSYSISARQPIKITGHIRKMYPLQNNFERSGNIPKKELSNKPSTCQTPSSSRSPCVTYTESAEG